MNQIWVLTYVAVLLRVSAIVMLLPAIGASYVPTRVKVALCILMTLIIAPVMLEDVRKSISVDLGVPIVFLREIATGIMIGVTMRLIVYAASFAGGLVTSLIGMVNVFGVNIEHNESSPILETFLALTTTALIFGSDTHLLIIAAIVKSYEDYPVGHFLESQQALVAVVDIVRRMTNIAIHIAAPILVFSAMANVAVALINRMVQQVPIYFVMSGAMLIGGFMLLGLTLDKSLTRVVDALVEGLLK